MLCQGAEAFESKHKSAQETVWLPEYHLKGTAISTKSQLAL